MNLIRSTFITSVVLSLFGCSTLDTSSDFSDAVLSVKERSNFIVVDTKPIKPDTEAIVGPDIVKSELSFQYVANFGAEQSSNYSAINMSATFFKSYSEFDSVAINGKDHKLTLTRPTSESCSEHCTVTRWFTIPFKPDSIYESKDEIVSFVISSRNKNKVKVSVPKAYFLAAKLEADSRVGNQATTATHKAEPSYMAKSKPQEMAVYWYQQMNAQQQETVTQWAVQNRRATDVEFETTDQAEQMFAYWFSQASEAEKKAIIIELINQ